MTKINRVITGGVNSPPPRQLGFGHLWTEAQIRALNIKKKKRGKGKRNGKVNG